MKLTLFTISNEQIKEQLSKLQIKVESLETVKDVQDKIISSKDSQITFLQGEISSISNWIIFVGSVIIALASAAFIYIKFLESKAKKKIKEAESKLQSAESKLQEIETAKEHTKNNLTESDKKIEQLNSLIAESNNVATIAQKKLDALGEWQKASSILSNINYLLYFIENNLKDSREEMFESHLKTPEEQLVLVNHFTNQCHLLRSWYSSALLKINQSVKEELNISDLETIKQLEKSVEKLHMDIIDNLYEHED